VGGFAGVAYEGKVFDADGGEAVFGVGAAVGANAVGGEAGEGFDGCFGGGWHYFFTFKSRRTRCSSWRFCGIIEKDG
jgi:hypothetical protein